jgi:hypothetical protein
MFFCWFFYVGSSNPAHGVLDTTLCDKVCHWLATDRWFSPGTPVSSTIIWSCESSCPVLRVSFSSSVM